MYDAAMRAQLAQRLAGLGFKIFPLAAGTKLPRLKGDWKEHATNDQATVATWFNEHPNMNYAVVCDDKHTILDPDEGVDRLGNAKNGIANFKRAEEDALGFVEDSIFDNTFRVRTPRGGVHLYFTTKRAYGRSLGSVIPNVDVSGFNGYVVGPGSHTLSDPGRGTAAGDYAIELDLPLAPLPEWLEKLMDGLDTEESTNIPHTIAAAPMDLPASIERAKGVLLTSEFAVQGAGGDSHTYKTVSRLKDSGLSPETCFDLIHNELLFPPTDEYPEGRSWNDCCSPPWNASDLRDKIDHAFQYGTRPPGIFVDAAAAYDGLEEDTTPLPKSDRTVTTPESYGTVTLDESIQKIEKLLFKGSGLMERKSDSYCLVKEWIPAQGITAVLAKRGDGKSMVMEDLCWRICSDMDWNGIPIAKDYACVYLCGEDDFGLQHNMKAWRTYNGRFPDDSRLAVAPAVPNLLDTAQVKIWTEVLRKRFQGRKTVVFVDTWHRATSGTDQNNNQDMSKCLQNALEMATSLGGCCIIAFHPPKSRNDTISGAGLLEDDGNAILRIDDIPGGKRLSVHRIKGSAGEGNSFMYNKKVVFFGDIDDEGNELSGVVPDYHGGSGLSPDNIRAEEDAIRSLIVGFIADKLPDQRRGFSFKDMGDIVLRECATNAALRDFLHNPSDVEMAEKYLHMLFHPGTSVDIGGAQVCVTDGRFVIRGIDGK